MHLFSNTSEWKDWNTSLACQQVLQKPGHEPFTKIGCVGAEMHPKLLRPEGWCGRPLVYNIKFFIKWIEIWGCTEKKGDKVERVWICFFGIPHILLQHFHLLVRSTQISEHKTAEEKVSILIHKLKASDERAGPSLWSAFPIIEYVPRWDVCRLSDCLCQCSICCVHLTKHKGKMNETEVLFFFLFFYFCATLLLLTRGWIFVNNLSVCLCSVLYFGHFLLDI